jgi:uncharacterized protein (DUF885 family)
MLLRTTAVVLALALASPVLAQSAAPTPAAAPANAEAAQFRTFLDDAFKAQVALSPQMLTQLGQKERYGELDDYSDAGQTRAMELSERQLAQMKRDFDPAKLSDADRLNWRLFEQNVVQARLQYKWRGNGFPISNTFTPTGSVPVFLINSHRVDSVADAQAYVSRLNAVGRVMNEVADTVEAEAKAGVVPPTFVFAPVIADSKKGLAGAPFAADADTPVWADFKAKVGALKTDDATKAKLLSDGEAALKGPYLAGYQRVIGTLETLAKTANSTDGVWRLPNGDAYYADMVKFSTTTDLTPDQVHKIGLSEMDRIHGEMNAIKDKVGFKGSLQDFFAYIKTDPKFHYSNDEAGKQQYLTDARALVTTYMAKGAPQQFSRLPKAPVEVRAVEAWREETAPVAFYNQGTPDGSRPGIYYVNLGDMRQVLKPQIEGITYHEATPGHHFQIARSQEQTDLPMFRRFGGDGAYVEGWGLYAEKLGKEAGFYQDPYSDFGRLSLELWRAARLVTDTGLHSKRWSRDKAIAYFKDNTLLSDRDVVKEVDRYITTPGQATSYKIGQLKILELRDKTRAALGSKFDLKAFHEVILGSGSLPLNVLEEQVDAYIASKK